MKKIAFILAIALIFLVGMTTVLKHKILADPPPSTNIALWIPIDQNGDVVFDKVNKICNTSREPKRLEKWPEEPVKVIWTKSITISKVHKNTYCYWIEQGWYMIERCF